MSHQQVLRFPFVKRYFRYHHILPLPAADANQTLCEANGLDLCGTYKRGNNRRVCQTEDKRILRKDGWNDAQMIGEEDGLGLHERELVTDG